MAEFAVQVVTDVLEVKEEDQWDELVEALAPVHGVPGMYLGELGAQVTVEATDLVTAAGIAQARVLDSVRRVVDPAAQVVGLEALTDGEFARRLDGPSPTDDLVGTTEAGRLLGVSRQRVGQLAEAFPEEFPRPVKHGRTLLWPQSGLRAFLARWDRSSGPKRVKSVSAR